MMINKRIKELRDLMEKNNLDAYIIPSVDAHGSEYLADHWKQREWISGFTGSAGTVVITKDKAGLWTDGRYFIQAASELEGTVIDLFKMRLPGTPTIKKWLYDELPAGSTVGVEGTLISKKQYDVYSKKFKEKNISLNCEHDLIGELWTDRPELPEDDVFLHPVEFAGETVEEKIEKVRNLLCDENATAYILTTLDDIAWLLNIRGSDVKNNPVVISYVLITLEEVVFYVYSNKLPFIIRENLMRSGIKCKEYDEVFKGISALENENIMFSPKDTNIKLVHAINETCKKIEKRNIITLMKSKKNETEIKHLKMVHEKDSVAMVKFLHWLDQTVPNQKITELDAERALEEFRKGIDGFKGNSFDYISAYKENAAMMHYKAKEEQQKTLKPESLYLIDSGGQYFAGTTDITRTVALGALTFEEKRDFTLALKGHIQLNQAIFLEGTTGTQLDILARMPLWKNGIDYKCGTGHGVGFFLSVHEGPQRIAPQINEIKLEEGMVLTNEPGVYKEKKHGIRIENTMIVTSHNETEHGKFLSFKVISYCPIDLRAVEVELLTSDEKKWLNTYHENVYRKLSPYLETNVKRWLKEATKKI